VRCRHCWQIGRVRLLAERCSKLEEDLKAQGVRFAFKATTWHQRLFHVLLCAVTLGAQRRYLESYVTTLGRTIYLPRNWEARTTAERYTTLRHERVHLDQFRRYGFLTMALAYLFLPLPMGISFCRMAIERAAYTETIRALYELGGQAAAQGARTHIIDQFTTAAYGWMWPFRRSLERWYDREVARCASERPS
jgi:hypothetical protein